MLISTWKNVLKDDIPEMGRLRSIGVSKPSPRLSRNMSTSPLHYYLLQDKSIKNNEIAQIRPLPCQSVARKNILERLALTCLDLVPISATLIRTAVFVQ